MKRRLLLDAEVVGLLESLPLRERAALWQRLREITAQPDRFMDYDERGPRGRDLAVHVFRGYAICFWDDFADRHVKVLEITRADSLED